MLTIELLGGLRLRRGNEHLPPIRSQKAAALLAYLALYPDRLHPRDTLMEVLWPGVDPEAGRPRLRTVLSQVRDIVEQEAERGAILHATRESVHLLQGSVETDVARFRASLPRRALEEAVALYRGELLPEMSDDWVLLERERLRQEFHEALRDFAARQAAAGDMEGAVGTARRLVERDPTLEEGHCLLMLLYLDAGQPAKAVQQYQRLEQALRSSLEVEPAQEARALLARARAASPAKLGDEASLSPPAAPAPSAPPAAPGAAVTETPRPHPTSPAHSAPLPLHHDVGRRPAPYLLFAAAACLLLTVVVAWRVVSAPARPGSKPGPTTPAASRPPLLWSVVLEQKEDEQDAEATTVIEAPHGGLYVVGYVRTTKTDVDFLTIKVSPEGEEVWRRKFNGKGNDLDRALDAVADRDGNVYVLGEADNGKGNGKTRLSGLDLMVVKYSPDGKELWARPLNGLANGEDRPTRMVLHPKGHLVILGMEWAPGPDGKGQTGIVLHALDTRNTMLWSRRYSGPGDDAPKDVACIGDSGRIFVAASSGGGTSAAPESDLLMLHYSPEGELLWKRRYGERNRHEDIGFRALRLPRTDDPGVVAQALGEDGSPDALNAGTLQLRYDTHGTLRSVFGTRTEADRIDRPTSIVMLGDGKLVLLGEAVDAKGRPVYRLVQRGPRGDVEWTTDAADYPKFPAAGNAVVTADSRDVVTAAITTSGRGDMSNDRDFVVARYDGRGALLWRDTYGEIARWDRATTITTLHDNSVVVSGQIQPTAEGARRVILRKYAQ